VVSLESSRKRVAERRNVSGKVARRQTPKPKTKKKKAADWEFGPIRAFKARQAFSDWLEINHAKSAGIWMRIAKKDSRKKTINYAEALEVALCYGWIDAQKRPENERTWLQRFVPRRPKSVWSRINRDKAMALIESGRMRPAGLAEIDRARADGRWQAAYDSPAQSQVPADFLEELDRNPRAKAFFATINRVNRYAIIWRLQTARTPETRAQRMRTFVEMLEKGETLH
jgi:uncharacterized protein YdeI (YjbR/CyaY-like superfamily)